MHVYSDPASERHVNALAPVEAPERFPAAVAGVEEARKAGAPAEWRACQPADEGVLATVHAPAYLEHLKELSATGGGYLNMDTALGSGSWETAILASGAAIAAADSALSGTPAFAVARPPGHHAGPDYGMGFCLTNHVAVAAGHARRQGVERIVILDWDVHHGNGTQDVFYGDGDVLFLSTHQSPFYPGTGAAGEVGEGAGEGFTVNVPLPAGSGEGAYAEVFAGVFLPLVREFSPGLILVSAGFDAHADDLLGGMALTAETFGRFAAWIAALARETGAPPPAFVLEGGYNLRALTQSVAAAVLGAGDEPPAWEYRGGVGPVERSRAALAPFWRGLR